MLTTTLTKNHKKTLTIEEKVDFIFNYIVEHKDNFFWNTIDESEEIELKNRAKGKFESFSDVKMQLLGK